MTGPPNTPAQVAFHKAREDAWADEQSWPLWDVVIEGDPTVWVPRNDVRYWMEEDPDDPNTAWVPRPAKELPADATLNSNGDVVRTARGTVTMRARNEDHARMIALRDNTDYHTVVSAKERKTS